MNRWLKARWFTLLGRQGLRSHQFEFSLKNFRKSAEQEPNNLRTAIEIAWCLHKLKNYTAAIEAYERAIQQRPDYASAHACRGLSLAEVQRHQEAIDELRRAVRIQPKSKHRWYWDYNLGTLLAYTERWEEAIEPLCHSIELKPREASTHYWLGRAYAQVQRHAEAVGEFKKALKLFPNEPDSLANLAYSFIQQGEYLTARQQLLKALERRTDIRDPATLDWLLVNLWWTWTFTEQYRESAEFFSTYVQSYPNDARGYSLRAASLWCSGEIQQAIEDYSKALALDPQDIVAHMGRGQVFAESGEFSRAIEDLDFVQDNLEQVQTGDVSSKTEIQAYSLSGRALAHAGLGDFERAQSEFDRSIFLCPDNAFVYFNRAVVYENRGRLADAAADYKVSLQKTMPKLTALKRKYAEVKVRTIG